MNPLIVDIVAGDTVIGSAELHPSDRSMGVAFAIFRPGPAYAIRSHARASEDRELVEGPVALSARTSAGVRLKCAGIDLVDFAETLGDEGREIHILGLEDFQTHFG